MLRKKKLDKDIETGIMSIGVVVWIGLGMFVFLRDLTRFGG